MRIRIVRDRYFTLPADRRVTVFYREDVEVTIKRAWGDQLVEDGDAEEIPAPPRRRKPGGV